MGFSGNSVTGMPKRQRCVGVLLAGLGGLIVIAAAVLDFAPIGSARAQERAANTVRPEIGKPIQAAVDLLKSKKGREALARVQEADAVPNKTLYEAYLVERVRGQAAAAAGDAIAAARAFEATAASSASSGAEKLQFLAAAAGQYYAAKDYGRAAELCARYFKDGGSDRAIRTVYIQSLYLGNDFAAAGRELLGDIQAEEQAGKTPAEDKLQLLASVYLKQHDNGGYANALEKLVAFHPKKEYWLAVVYSVGARSGFSERLALDFARLKLATGTMRTATEYIEAAQLSLQAGFPAEARKIIDQGYSAGLLGTGPESDRHRRLKDMAARNLAEDKKTLGQDDAQAAAAKDGTALVNAGFNYVLHGSGDNGLEMMEQGIRRGSLKRPDDARLHLGYAYHVAGQNQKAIQVFKMVQGADGTAALARLWVIHLGHGS
jgi:hypothetical protein